MVGPNSDRYLELYLTVPSCGYVFVPVNARLAAPEMLGLFADAAPRVVFMDGDFPVPESAEHVIHIGEEYEQFIASSDERTLQGHAAEDDLAVLFYTSGTTGVGKGAMHTHRGLISSGMHFAATWPFRQDSRWLVCSPMFHTGGTLAITATMFAGGGHVLIPAFEANAALELIQEHKVTHTLMVPTMLASAAKAQNQEPRNVDSMKYLSHGASPISVETLKATRRAFPDAELLHVYGTTETTPVTIFLTHEEKIIDTPLVKSCGQPAVGMEVRVFDQDTGEEAPRGTVGELWIRGPSVMKAYWNKPEETEKVLPGDGWYRTGDLGYMDENAYIYLVDRAKDMIVTGGENVYSVEVEAVLSAHESVDEVAVFGVPDDRWGESVYAVVYLTEEVTEDELIVHCKSAIAGYKVPKHIEISLAPLPKSAAGKLLKRQLREPHWQGKENLVAGS